jgi:uncharacterized protein YuzE
MASFEFDPEVSVLYLWLRNGKPTSTETFGEDVVVDLDDHGRAVGLELFLPPKMRKEIKEQLAADARRSLRRGTRANPPKYLMLR